jgi:sterol desaturase/sphingolipid hydroxylase (fatty acid hydroxylase superfamily)
MNILEVLKDELTGFLGINGWLKMFQSGDYSSLRTLNGIESAIGPLIPAIMLIEIFRTFLFKRNQMGNYKITFLIYIFNRVVGSFLRIGAFAFCVGLFQPIAILKTDFTWYWLIYGYIVWEFSHFIYHYLGHKVRLFWCLHSTHHAPESMNLTISFAHFFLEGPYADIIRTSICILLGVNPPLLLFIMFIDGTWGAFIHVGERIMKDGRLGFLNKFILTPSHHRVHHARNPLYMDTNFCNLLNIWDRIFKTHQPEKLDIPPEYGITRKINANNFLDVYFGEFMLLGSDIAAAPGLKNKLLYMVMPPGWSHTGAHKTAAVVRKEYLKQTAAASNLTG